MEGSEAVRHSNPQVERIHIVVDNTAVAGVLRRCYSSNAKATEMLKGLKARVRAIVVPSEVNVADSPSRNTRIEENRRIRTWRAFQGDDEGRREGNAQRHPNLSSGTLRHEEDIEGFDDDLLMDTLPTSYDFTPDDDEI